MSVIAHWRVLLLGGLAVIAGVVAYPWLTSTSPPSSEGSQATTEPPRRFKPHKEPVPVAEIRFQDARGRELTLANFKGKAVLLNMWATWCPPCRKEMPTLDRLQATLGGPGFEVVALSIDRDGSASVRTFYDEIQIRSLPIYVDPSADAMQKLSIVGVPTTMLIDASGREVWRHVGPETWDAPAIVDELRDAIAPSRETVK